MYMLALCLLLLRFIIEVYMNRMIHDGRRHHCFWFITIEHRPMFLYNYLQLLPNYVMRVLHIFINSLVWDRIPDCRDLTVEWQWYIIRLVIQNLTCWLSLHSLGQWRGMLSHSTWTITSVVNHPSCTFGHLSCVLNPVQCVRLHCPSSLVVLMPNHDPYLLFVSNLTAKAWIEDASGRDYKGVIRC